jgi:hypothetical protein
VSRGVTIERFEHGRDAHECRRLRRYGLRLAPRAGRWVKLQGWAFETVVEARSALRADAEQYSGSMMRLGSGPYRIRKADGELWRDTYRIGLGWMIVLCADGREIAYVGAPATYLRSASVDLRARG